MNIKEAKEQIKNAIKEQIAGRISIRIIKNAGCMKNASGGGNYSSVRRKPIYMGSVRIFPSCPTL